MSDSACIEKQNRTFACRFKFCRKWTTSLIGSRTVIIHD